MSSFTKQSSTGKPKLGRSNALKIIDYDPTSSSPSPSSSSRRSSKDFLEPSHRVKPEESYRLTGNDSKNQIDRICEELGLSGGADAFAIPQDAWEAGKSRSPSVKRYNLDLQVRSKSLDEKVARLFEDKGFGSEEGHGAGKCDEMQSELRRRGNSCRDMPYSSGSESISSSTSSLFTDSFSSDTSTSHTDSFISSLVDEHIPQRREDASVATRLQDEENNISAVNRISKDMEQMMHVTQHPPSIRTKSSLAQEPLKNDEIKDVKVETTPVVVSDGSSTGSEFTSQSSVTEEKLEVFVSKVVEKQRLPTKETPSVVEPPSPLSTSEDLINISSWRKLDLLGSGSFGTVYEGLSEDGVYFAVKEVSLSESDLKAQQCVSQLEQEIEVLSKFKHENIVRYLGTQKEPDKLYIFLELVTKGSLASLYAKYPLFESQIRIYTRQILSGLKYLHERNIMHRDIKCANILVDVNGKIKVADFGLARQISQLDELKSCKGSAYWMAPEVVNPRKSYSFPADIWSLGCTVLEMETRRPPFGDMEWHRALWKIGHGEAPPIPETLSDDAKDFIAMCLEVEPEKRPSAAELLRHPFVQYTSGSGFTPKNSFNQETLQQSGENSDKG